MVSRIKAKIWRWFRISISGLWLALPGQLVHSCTNWVMHGTEYREELSGVERVARVRQVVRNTTRLSDIKKIDYLSEEIHPLIILL